MLISVFKPTGKATKQTKHKQSTFWFTLFLSVTPEWSQPHGRHVCVFSHRRIINDERKSAFSGKINTERLMRWKLRFTAELRPFVHSHQESCWELGLLILQVFHMKPLPKTELIICSRGGAKSERRKTVEGAQFKMREMQTRCIYMFE